jgi:uncharacterized lipoprotein YmbA
MCLIIQTRFKVMIRRLTLPAIVVVIASCSPLAPLPNRNKFFMLSPISQEGDVGTTSAALDQQLGIGVGPIDFPDYVKRPEVVTRTAPNRIDVSEDNRWAGPLDKNFSRVLSENLSTLLNTQRVQNYPWNRLTPVDYQVLVNVGQFDTNGKQATLVARWWIRDGRDGRELYATETISNAPIGAGAEGPSAALSSNVATLSREIASQLALLRQHPHSVQSQR